MSILIAIAIVLLSVLPFPEVKMVEDIPFADKWVHFIMYGALSLILWFEMRKRERKILLSDSLRGPKPASFYQMLVWGLIYPAVLGGLMELAQAYLTTTRSGEWMDFLADGVGAVLGTILGLIVRRVW